MQTKLYAISISTVISFFLYQILVIDTNIKQPTLSTLTPTPPSSNELPEIDDKELIALFNDISQLEPHTKNLGKQPLSDKTINIFTEVESDTIEEKFLAKEGVTPLLTVNLDKEKIQSLQVGEKIRLPLVGQVEYESIINEKTRHNNGSFSLLGTLTNYEEPYSVILTQGEEYSFATLSTPEGTFEIEAEEDQGYVYAVNDIDNAWIDYSKSDILTP
ncbi:MAG: hypothetical protein K0U38_05465 [Epsilonproteobacteria bacterium]|nr:hypothetical protein [Campylobacterota bacterium]